MSLCNQQGVHVVSASYGSYAYSDAQYTAIQALGCATGGASGAGGAQRVMSALPPAGKRSTFAFAFAQAAPRGAFPPPPRRAAISHCAAPPPRPSCRANGTLFVAAAGNEMIDNNQQPLYPASYNTPSNNVVSVAASLPSDGLVYFSNYGSTSVHLGERAGRLRRLGIGLAWRGSAGLCGVLRRARHMMWLHRAGHRLPVLSLRRLHRWARLGPLADPCRSARRHPSRTRLQPRLASASGRQSPGATLRTSFTGAVWCEHEPPAAAAQVTQQKCSCCIAPTQVCGVSQSAALQAPLPLNCFAPPSLQLRAAVPAAASA